MLDRRTWRAAMLGLLVVAASACGAQAQAPWPAKPITMVVTYPPGGGADLMARLVAPKMSEVIGQPIVVENKGGAAGQIGAAAVAKAAPDGYTLMVDAASFAINPGLSPKLPYEPTAFKPIGVLARYPHVIVVHPGFATSALADLVSIVKAKPGSVSYASTGTGGAQHLAAALFLQKTGLDMVHVPYKGGGPAINDVMGGHVPVFFANVASSLAHIKSGKLRGLAIAGEKRVDAIGQVMTLKELGIEGAEMYEWNGLFVPAGTPDAIVMRLAEALKTALEVPETRERILSLGGEILPGGPGEAAQFISTQAKQLAEVIRAGNIKPE